MSQGLPMSQGFHMSQGLQWLWHYDMLMTLWHGYDIMKWIWHQCVMDMKWYDIDITLSQYGDLNT